MRENNLIDLFNWIGQAKPQKEIIGHFHLIESIDLSRFQWKPRFEEPEIVTFSRRLRRREGAKMIPFGGTFWFTFWNPSGARNAWKHKENKGFWAFCPPAKGFVSGHFLNHFRVIFWLVSAPFWGSCLAELPRVRTKAQKKIILHFYLIEWIDEAEPRAQKEIIIHFYLIEWIDFGRIRPDPKENKDFILSLIV